MKYPLPAKTHLLFALASVLACSATSTTAGAAEAAAAVEQTQAPLYRPFTLGLEAGTTGFGGYGSWRFADHFGVRAGGDYFSLSDVGVEVEGIHYNTKLQLISQPLTFDIYPWKKHSFHISLGVMFNENSLTGTAEQDGTIVVDGQPLPINSLGTLNAKVEQQLVNPYLSIGGNFFYFDHAHHWSLGGELGVAYTGSAEATVWSSRSGPVVDRAVSVAQSQLHDWANQYKWWPIAKLMVNWSF
jgi:hypothetical protein